MQHTYLPCPNGCDGEVPMVIEYEDGPDPTVGLFYASYGTCVDDVADASSHDPGCPPLTTEQREKLQTAADERVNAPDFWSGEP